VKEITSCDADGCRVSVSVKEPGIVKLSDGRTIKNNEMK